MFGYFWNQREVRKRQPDLGFSRNQLTYSKFYFILNIKIDEYRSSLDLDCLEFDFELSLIAYRRLTDLIGKPLSHEGWTKKLIARKNYGEILARGFGLSYQSILEGWQNSSSHKEVLTSDKFNKIGIATDGNTVVAILSN